MTIYIQLHTYCQKTVNPISPLAWRHLWVVKKLDLDWIFYIFAAPCELNKEHFEGCNDTFFNVIIFFFSAMLEPTARYPPSVGGPRLQMDTSSLDTAVDLSTKNESIHDNDNDADDSEDEAPLDHKVSYIVLYEYYFFTELWKGATSL